jgi:hypothetical protein
VKMTSYWKCTTSVNTKSFHALTVVFNVTVKMKIARKQLLTNCGESEDQETDEDDTPERERATNQDARKCTAALRLCIMKEGNESCPISALETCADSVQLQSIK